MTNDEGESITPEIRIKQLEERLVEESDRLEKLYVAYRKVEQELEEKNAIIDVLEKEAIDKETTGTDGVFLYFLHISQFLDFFFSRTRDGLRGWYLA